MKVSDYIVHFYHQKGLDTCFCVTGGGAMHFNDSFGHSNLFTNIYTHHEQAAAMAAEGYARIKSIPAIVSVTSGPGATNAITGVYGAWQDSIPMIVLSGQMKSSTISQSTPAEVRYLGFQESNIIPMIKTITKYSAVVLDIRDLKYHLEKSFDLAVSGRKGPVWLDIPLDIQGTNIDPEINFIDGTKYVSNLYKNFPKPLKSQLEELTLAIKKSKRPVIMLGEEIRMANAVNDVLSLIELIGIPVVTEWNAHDLIPTESPYQCGRPGTIGDRGGNYTVQGSDFLLCIGCQLSIRQISYEWKNFASKAFIAAVNIDEAELEKPTINVQMPIVSDVKEFCSKFYQFLKKYPLNSDFSKWLGWSKSIWEKYPVVQSKHFDKNQPLDVYPFIKLLSNFAEVDTITVLANGAACVCGLQAFDIKTNTRLFTNAGASSMGYGIAASIGASIGADKKRIVVCVEGDGSLMMNLQELATIVQNNLNIKIIIINNQGYHSIKQTQASLFNAKEKGYCGANPESGLSFPNFQKIADSFGLFYIKIEAVSKMDANLKNMFEFKGPVICEIFTDPDQIFEPKLASKLNKDGSFETPSLELMSPFLSDEEHLLNIYNDS